MPPAVEVRVHWLSWAAWPEEHEDYSMADDDAREWELERLRDANEALRARNTALEAEVRHLRRPAVVLVQCDAHAGQPFALQVPHAEPLRRVCPQCAEGQTQRDKRTWRDGVR